VSSHLERCLNSLTSTPAHSDQFTHAKQARSAMVHLLPTRNGPCVPGAPLGCDPAVDAAVPAAVLLAEDCWMRRSSRTWYRRLVW
jgi:hypothetical protein